MEDNLMPNDGEFFTPFKQESKKAAEPKISGAKLIKQVVGRFDERIAKTDSNKFTREFAESYKIPYEEASALMDLLRNELEQERGFLQTYLD